MTLSMPLRATIQQVANAYALPADLLTGQVLLESGGDPFAFRYEPAFFKTYIRDDPETPAREHPNAKAQRYGPLAACSYGLLQCMLETAVELGFDGQPWDLFTDRIGLAWGAKYMRALLDRFKDAPDSYIKALCAYNGGLGAVQAGPPYRTQAYADAVYRLAGRTT